MYYQRIRVTLSITKRNTPLEAYNSTVVAVNTKVYALPLAPLSRWIYLNVIIALQQNCHLRTNIL